MSAVNILHTQSPPIQHRDLKVENVLYKTASDSYLLCDFGSATTREYPHPSALSKSQMATLDEDIQRYTTLMYRSPEMVDLYTHLPITTQSDIWMCGCRLLEEEEGHLPPPTTIDQHRQVYYLHLSAIGTLSKTSQCWPSPMLSNDDDNASTLIYAVKYRYHIDAKASERHPRPLTDLCRWMLSRDPTRRPTAKQVSSRFIRH